MKRRVVCLSKEYVYLKFMSTYITYPLTTESVYLLKIVCLSKVYVNLDYSASNRNVDDRGTWM